jgi:hypothetical protein
MNFWLEALIIKGAFFMKYYWLRYHLDKNGEKILDDSEIHEISRELYEELAVDRGYLPETWSFEIYEGDDSFTASYIDIYTRSQL